MGDIKAMLLLLLFDEEDQNVLRFLGFKNGDLSQRAETYQMKMHVFGAKSSSYCAAYALRRTVSDNITRGDSNTVNAVRRNIGPYVLSGGPN